MIINYLSQKRRSRNIPLTSLGQKFYASHMMINLFAFMGDPVEVVQAQKDAGYTVIWAHLDDWDESYEGLLTDLFAACEQVGDIKVMPGWFMFEDAKVVDIVSSTFSQTALLKIGGKPVYSAWDYRYIIDNYHQPIINSSLASLGINESDYLFWVNPRFPEYYGNGTFAEFVYDGHILWSGRSAALHKEEVDRLYEVIPQLDGSIAFAVGSSEEVLKNQNLIIAQSSKEKGKLSMAGTSAFYCSVSAFNFGYAGYARILQAVLDLPVGDRPSALCDITADDYAELSYISPVPTTENGVFYAPVIGSGFHLGNNIRYPMLDHSGIQAFGRPWYDAFLNDAAQPVFTEDKIFCWYWPHPFEVNTIPNIPNEVAALDGANTQEWWANTVYATGSIQVGGKNQVSEIKFNFQDQIEVISMAVHLTAPAYLKINDTVSTLKDAGFAYFEIPQVLGTPEFAIIRNDVEVKKGVGQVPITNSIYPAAYNFFASEVDYVEPGTNELGYVYNQSSWTDLTSPLLETNAGFTVSSNKIQVASNAAETNYLRLKNPTALRDYEFKVTYKFTGTGSGTNNGLHLDMESVNTFVNASVRCHLVHDPASADYKKAKVFASGNGTTWLSTGSLSTISVNDVIELTLKQVEIEYTSFTVKNVTTNETISVSASNVNGLMYNGAPTMFHNTAQYTIKASGGTYEIQSLSVYGFDQKGGDLAVGDSITKGYAAGTWAERYATLIGAKVNAGSGDRSFEVVARLPEIISLEPSRVLVMIGTNNFDDSQYRTDLATIKTTLETEGIEVIFLTPVTNKAFTVDTMRDYLLSQYPSQSIDTFTPMLTPGYGSGDTIHPNVYGMKGIADAVQYSPVYTGTTVTPATPTSFVTNDNANKADWTYSPGFERATDYEYRINGGSITAVTAKPIAGITGAISAGQFEIRVKAATNRNASGWLSNTVAFTSGTASIPLLSALTVITAPIESGTGFYGLKITPVVNVTVTDIGRWVLPGNNQSHLLKIVNGSNVTIVSCTLNLNGAAPGGFKYQPCTPTVLTAGTAYFILSEEVNGGDIFFSHGNIEATPTADITLGGAVYGTSVQNVNYPGNGPVNIQYHL